MKNIFSLFFLLSSLSLFAQDSFKEVDELLKKYDQPDEPGFSIGIVEKGKLVYAKGFGAANLDHQIPNDEHTVFRIASTSKQFTAACIFLLEEQGKLDLDKSLRSIYPDFPAYADKITIRQLVHHTSGIRDYLTLAYLSGLDDNTSYYTDETIMEWLIHQKETNFEPGSEYTYSNSGYWLLGQIVEKISGENMAVFARKHIFEPLEMENTHFHNNPNQIVKNRATGYTDVEDRFEISRTVLPMIGDGGIFTTIVDFNKWVDELSKPSKLSATFWKNMKTRGRLNNGSEINYAGGLDYGSYKGIKKIGHNGAFVGYLANFDYFPEEELAIFCFTNRNDVGPWTITNQILAILFKDKLESKEEKKKQKKEQAKTITLSANDLKSFVGEYTLEPGATVSVALEENKLQFTQNWNGSSYTVDPISKTAFILPKNADILFEFENIENEMAQTLIVFQGKNKSVCERVNKFDASTLKLEEFVGTYFSEELKTTYTISQTGKTLEFKMGNRGPWTLEPSAKDVFSAQGILFEFVREKEKNIGFTVNAGRAKNIFFIKK